MDINRGTTSIREIVSLFREWAGDSSTMISQTSNFSTRLILRYLIMARATLLNQNLLRGANPDRYTIQTIGCIPLEEIDLIECPCAPASGCTWLRTQYKVPVPIGSFVNVVSIDGTIHYDYTNWSDVKYKFYSRIKGERDSPTYTVKDGYIYVHNDIHKKSLTVSGVFSDPRAPQLIDACNSRYDNCTSPLDLEFPMNVDMHSVLFETTWRTLINVKQSSNTDVRIDSQQNIGQDNLQKQ
jgi:hypothetical protein